MASTTKIMTALLGIEFLPLEKEIKVGNEVLNVEGTSLGLKPGDTILAYDLLVGLMLSSGNDAANAVAAAVCGSVDDFVALMNQRAEDIGMTSTSFATASGLDDENHYSTAYDMALLTRTALQNDVFVQIASTYTATIHISGQKLWLKNHNRLLQSYEGMIGVKTGFTKKSGRCLVTAAERDDKRLIAVTLHDPNDWRDHCELLDYGFSVLERYAVFDEMPLFYVDVVGASADKVACSPAYMPMYSADKKLDTVDVTVQVEPFVYAPVAVGDIVGELVVYHNGKKILSVPLCADESIENIVIPIESQSKWDHFLAIIERMVF